MILTEENAEKIYSCARIDPDSRFILAIDAKKYNRLGDVEKRLKRLESETGANWQIMYALGWILLEG